MRDLILKHEYKGYVIRLYPLEKHCSRFSMTMEDADGTVLRTVQAAGKTEESALARAREMIDTELAMR